MWAWRIGETRMKYLLFLSFFFSVVLLTATALSTTQRLWATSHCTPCLMFSKSRWMEHSLMDLDTKATAVQHNPLHKLCKCHLQSCVPWPLSCVWLGCDYKYPDDIFFSCTLIKAALKRSRRTRRYVKIMLMSLRRAQMSTARAQRWTKMRTAARRDTISTLIACLLSDDDAEIVHRNATSLTACVALYSKKQQLRRNQTLCSLEIFFPAFTSLSYVFVFLNLALNSFCKVEWDHKKLHLWNLSSHDFAYFIYLHTEWPSWAEKPKERELW